jgi:hypothetical protein
MFLDIWIISPFFAGQNGLTGRRRRCANALVIAVSTSDSARDREQMTELGVNGYFRKPSECAAFMKLGDLVKGLLAERTHDQRE